MSQIAFKIEIHPVFIKKFDNNGIAKEVLSHYMGYIHGITHLGLKNLYLTNNRRSMIDEMFTTLKYANILPV
jgi:hypothetical protein